MQPWMVALIFSVLPLIRKPATIRTPASIRSSKAQAEKEGDKIDGFETAEEQIRFLAELPEAEQIAFLEDTSERRGEGNRSAR